MALRSPICTVVGHVDHGKTTLLDSIRRTAVAAQEAGKITQAIGASVIPIATIKTICGPLFPKDKISVPGILFIDTPGHEAFTSLRKRGGSLADIAILIVDMHEGFKPQTREALEILRASKTPFVVAASKMDLAPNYRKASERVVADINGQRENVTTYFETKLYEIVGTLSEYGFPSERFDRIENFQKQIAIVPISAPSLHGLAELLVVILGLAQRFLEAELAFSAEGPGKGVILEVKETQGFGTTLDVILYDGHVKVGDTIVVGTLTEPITTKVRALLEPAPNVDVRDKKAKFQAVDKAYAATGVKIAAPGLDGALAGMPVVVAADAASVAEAFKTPEALLEGEQQGVIIKADTLGSLEALVHLLRAKSVPVHRASIGPINKKDIAEAEAQPEPIIVAFNVPMGAGVVPGIVTVIRGDIIYAVVEHLEEFRASRSKESHTTVRPTKIEILPNHIFRQSNPLICGVHIHAGELRTGMHLVKNGVRVGTLKALQENKESIDRATMGKSVAASIEGPTAGRQVMEGDMLYSEINEETFRALKQIASELKTPEKAALRELVEAYRKTNPMWGV